MDKKTLFIGVLIGVATSTVIQLLVLRHRPPFFGGPPWMHKGKDGLQERFVRELELRPEQEATVVPHLRAFQEKLRAAREAQFAAVEDAVSRLEATIEPTLDADQQKRLRKMRKKFEKIRARRGPPPAP